MFLKIQNLHWVEVAYQPFIIPGVMQIQPEVLRRQGPVSLSMTLAGYNRMGVLRFRMAGVHSSGIEVNRGEMLEIMSSCFKAVVIHDCALVSARRDKWGPVRKVRDKVNQLMIGLVLQSHGRLSMIGADG